MPGYHLHFPTEDKRAGGHLLECRTVQAELCVDMRQNYDSSFRPASTRSRSTPQRLRARCLTASKKRSQRRQILKCTSGLSLHHVFGF